MHAALLLAVVMISLAVLYPVQDAPFLFAVQIIVYTGAILMLFLFVVMLVGVDASDSLVETIRGQRLAGASSSGLLFGVTLVARRRPGRRVGAVAGLDEANADGNVTGARPAALHQLRLRLRGHQRAAHHRGDGRDGAGAPGAAGARSRRRPTWPLQRMRDYADHGKHPGPLPTPGVFARHNAVDTPALLPDGTPSELSVSRVLAARGTVSGSRSWPSDVEAARRRGEEDESSERHPVPGPLRDPVHDRLRRRAHPPQRDRGVHVRRADAQRLEPRAW